MAKKITLCVEWVEVTPALAKEWLDKHSNPNNRGPNWKRVTAMANDMATGQWDVTHQGIAFTSDDKRAKEISDGHHRLHAIIKSGATIRLMVTYGVPHAAIIDGGWGRSISQARSMRGEDPKKSHHRYVGIVRSLLKLEADDMGLFVTEKQMREAEDRHLAALCWHYDTYARSVPACAWAALCFSYPFAPDAVDDLAKAATGDGAGLAADTPTLAYRNMLLRSSAAGQANSQAIMWKTFTAVRAHMQRKKTIRLMASEEDYQWFRTQWEMSQ